MLDAQPMVNTEHHPTDQIDRGTGRKGGRETCRDTGGIQEYRETGREAFRESSQQIQRQANASAIASNINSTSPNVIWYGIFRMGVSKSIITSWKANDLITKRQMR